MGGVRREHVSDGVRRHHADLRFFALRLDVGAVGRDYRDARRKLAEDLGDLEALVARRNGEAAAGGAHALEDGAEAIAREVLAAEVEKRPVLVGDHELDQVLVYHCVSPYIGTRTQVYTSRA